VRELPAVALSVLAELTPTGPANELAPVVVARVPPSRVTVSVVLYEMFRKSSVAPAATVVPAVFVPSALLAVTANVPPLTVVAPL
jgi:hypothetical protein